MGGTNRTNAPDVNIGWDTSRPSPLRSYAVPLRVTMQAVRHCSGVSNNQPPAHTEVAYLILWEGGPWQSDSRREKERCGSTGGEAFIPSTPALML